MDYLPIQATSVPCERVFSSAKETDTAKRSRISPVLMEALQLLKFMLKKQRLDFTGGWATSEEAMRGEVLDNNLLGALVNDTTTVVMDNILESFYTYD
jgi:hAT family C-terminal dimerisation region